MTVPTPHVPQQPPPSTEYFEEYPPDDCICNWTSPDDRGWRLAARKHDCPSEYHTDSQ